MQDLIYGVREGLERKARSAARTCSVKPDPQGHALSIHTIRNTL